MPAIFKDRPIVAYYPMWIEKQNWLTPNNCALSKINRAVNVVILAFIDPSKPYSGSLDAAISDYFFEGEGKALGDVASLKHLKEAIHLCKIHHPGRKVLVSAGGEIGGEFINADFSSLALLVAELDLDGLDLDYEPDQVMTQTPAQIAIYQKIIIEARLALDQQTQRTGKKYLLSCAPTAVGLLSENEQKIEFIEQVAQRLAPLVVASEHTDALHVGQLMDDPEGSKSSALSAFNFKASGKMRDVFLQKSAYENYPYVGNMVDIVIYQAYNMGSVNLLGRLLCYESHRAISEFLQKNTDQGGFSIIHGSHIGQEAFPRYSHTLSRLTTIYSYICLYGEANDGASFWSYGQDPVDQQDYLPAHGMGYTDSKEVFESMALLHDKYHVNYATVQP
ncbi:glycosyl hydrolase family 18 protein [Psychromonas sp. Urea-02u-13]|uniref:glycosyl hydrolase family 18 protein n=1 Tax=Psychromonas sp. Urea-02u-13 TaxID=2058326 RepID=UPI000C335B7D|nr:glycosyl hydrolase family 18 protein [Psychromonas sp. Urea-02u-13]PKG40992.1 hypothetical protein CXF74_00410 [Psychromonas sp. Urea-02u-13]